MLFADHGPRFLFPLLLLVLLGLLIGLIIRRRRNSGSHSHGRGSAMQTLQDRFARGEIDRAEFDHRKAVLDGSDNVPPAPGRSATTQGAPAGTQTTTAPRADSPEVNNPDINKPEINREE